MGALGFFRGFKIRAEKKLIENIPTSTVRGLAVGLAEVQGSAAVFQKMLQSHFTKIECVFFRYKVEEYRSSGKSGRWVTIAEYSSPELFCLEDETGKVLVDPADAEYFLAEDRKYNLGFGAKDKDTFEGGLTTLGISAQGFLGMDKSLRCSESYVLPGDRIYVMGTACPQTGGEYSAQGADNLCLRKEGDSFFCISDESEKELRASLSRKMYFYLYGGPALTVCCLYFLIQFYFRSIF